MSHQAEILTKKEIIQFIHTHRITIKSFGVHRLGLFGSYVRNEQKEGSDLDFLVEFVSGQKNLKNYFGLMDWLEASFGKEVELLTQESLSPYIGPHIEKEVEYASLTG